MTSWMKRLSLNGARRYVILHFYLLLKFIYSEKATKFCEISTVDLTGIGQIYAGDIANICGLLRIHELYDRAEYLSRNLKLNI